MRRLCSLLRDQRGTASIEAAVMLPIMAICWAGLFLQAAKLDGALDAAAEARNTAWTHSNAGCVGDSLDYVCDEESGGGAGWMSELASVPIVGGLFGSFAGYGTDVAISRTYGAPPLLGGGQRRFTYHYYIMCNERPMDVTDILKNAICEATHTFGLSLSFAVSCPPARHPAASCKGP